MIDVAEAFENPLELDADAGRDPGIAEGSEGPAQSRLFALKEIESVDAALEIPEAWISFDRLILGV